MTKLYSSASKDFILPTDIETEIEESDYQTRQRFGSYILIYEHFVQSEWEDFRICNFEEKLEEVIPKISMQKVLVLCERHTDYLHIFLNFFANINQKQYPPKHFLPFLISIVPLLPIKWISKFALHIDDVRYTYLFLSAAFNSCVNVKPGILQLLQRNQDTWDKYVKRYKVEGSEHYVTIWQHLIEYRTASKELIDYKIEYKLADYLKCDKEEFMLKMIKQSDSPVKFLKALKAQIIPYCQANQIDLESLIVKGIPKRTYDVPSKLKILSDYVSTTKLRSQFLSDMTYTSDEELQQIKDYAKQNNLNYEPSPQVVEHFENKPRTAFRARSGSIGLMLTNARAQTSGPAAARLEGNSSNIGPLKPPTRSDGWKRSPSIELDKNKGGGNNNYSIIADGKADTPEAYAERLHKFRNLKEIRPIFDLAETYAIIISYDDFREIQNRQKIFDKLIAQDGWDNFTTICQVLTLQPHDVFDHLNSTQKYDTQGKVILPKLFTITDRWNSNHFMKYLDRAVNNLWDKMPFPEFAELWLSALQNIFTKVSPDAIDYIVFLARVINSAKFLQDPVEQKKLILDYQKGYALEILAGRLIDNGSQAAGKYLMKNIPEYSEKDFYDDFNSKDIHLVSTAVLQIRQMENKTTAMKILHKMIPSIDGQEYTLISYIYSLLSSCGFSCQHQLDILSKLHSGQKVFVNFHELVKSPLETLQAATNTDTIQGILPIAKAMNINEDSLVVHVMTNKMNSQYFDDYKQYVKLLRQKSQEELIKVVVPRLKPEEQPQFFQSLGMVEQQRKIQTISDLSNNGLSEFSTTELLNNPRKLITELYNKTALQDSLGKRLHKIVDRIASRYSINPKTFKPELIKNWLSAEYPAFTDSRNIFEPNPTEQLYAADKSAVQQALFVLRTWTILDSVSWLKKFIEEDIPLRARARGICCLFCIGDLVTIQRTFGDTDKLNMDYTYSILAAHAMAYGHNFTPEQFRQENIDATLKDINEPWKYSVMAAVFIDNSDRLADLFPKMAETRKLQLLQLFTRVKDMSCVQHQEIKDALIVAISEAFEWLLKKDDTNKAQKSRQLKILRLIFRAMSTLPPIPHLIINGENVPIEDCMKSLIQCGLSAFAADIAAHLTDLQIRHKGVYTLVRDGCYDLALEYGFPDEQIFSIILETDLKAATETMVDNSFVQFTNWLHRKGDKASLKLVKEFLREQGRTREVKRMKERFAKLDAENQK